MWIFKVCVPLLLMAVLAASDSNFGRRGRNRHSHNHRHNHQRGRQGRQESGGAEQEAVPGGVDFSGCEMQDDGMCCVMREEEIQELVKDPVLECTHKNVEKCHYTYVTEFTPAQEEVCEENFEKKCQITFKQMAVTETVKKCYRPLMKTCGNEATPSRLRIKRQLPGYGETQSDSQADANNEQCKTFYESACTTKYVEKQPGKFVGDTKCEKLPVELCGQGCKVEEGEEECHDKEIDTLIDVPEEVCDLNPQKTCRFQTKLVPKLKPTHECTIIPQEICQLKFSSPRTEPKPFMSKWCIDPNAEPIPDTGSYDESEAQDEPLGPEDDEGSKPDALYGAPGADYNDYGEEELGIAPPPPPAADAFEQAESSFEEPVYDDTALSTDYGRPQAPNNLYDAPSRGGAAAASGGPRRNGNGGGGPSRRRQPQNRRRGNGGRRPQQQQQQPQNPSTLYGAPVSSIAPLAEYGASAPLPAYGSNDDLPSYGNRRSSSASNLVPVYVPAGRRRTPRYYFV